MQTNLLYYRGNYAVICGGVALLSILLRPVLLISTAVSAGIVYGAVEWGDAPVPGLNAPLTFEQRAAAGALAAMAFVNWFGSAGEVARVVLLCTGMTLGHATFRARSIAARWTFFKDSVGKED